MLKSAILLVEDNPNDRLLIERAFRKASLSSSMHQVADGDKAVAYLSGEEGYGDREQYPLPGLILLDLKLPRRSGLEVLEWIRSHPELRRTPVVVLTSSRESVDLARAYDLGVNSYLVKPVSPIDLQTMVQTLGTYWLTMNLAPEN